MALSIVEEISLPSPESIANGVEQYFQTAMGSASELGGTISESIAGEAAVEAGVETASLGAACETIIAVALILCCIVVLDLLAILLWNMRQLVGGIPLAGGPLTHMFDWLLQHLAGLVEPANSAVTDQVASLGRAVHSFFGTMGHLMHWTSAEVMHTTVNIYHEQARNIALEAKHIATSAEDLANNVRTELRSDVHGIWSRIHDLQIQIEHLTHLENQTERLAEQTAKEVIPLLSQVPQLWHWAHYFYDQIGIIFTDIKIEEKEIKDLQKKVTELERMILTLTEVVLPALATVEVLSMLTPLLDGGEEGVRCLQEQAMDCGRSDKVPEEEKCWLPSLIDMAGKFKFKDV